MMWGFSDLFGWWMMAMMSAWMLLFSGVVIWGVYRFTRSQSGEVRNPESALETARMRLARGDISKEEFEEIRSFVE